MGGIRHMGQLNELNSVVTDRAIKILEPMIERAPNVAARVAQQRPFLDVEDLRNKIRLVLLNLGEGECISLFREHPELAPDNPLTMTDASQSEQGRLNLTSAASEYRTRLTELNNQYRSKFGFPFITALVHHKDMQSVLTEFEARLELNLSEEIKNAIGQIVAVSSARVEAAFGRDATETSHDVTASR
jgi:OHCU decarboxylase